MAQAQPEFGLTLPILLLCCSEFLKRVLEIWRPWSRNCYLRSQSGFGRIVGNPEVTARSEFLNSGNPRLVIGPKWPQIDHRKATERLEYAVHPGDANPRCVPGGGST